ncbi:formate dehydrogenase accessory protein FdhE [Bacillus sp. Marseille-P3661]|uniref:formate dehydrogenase accessory protein FdhE n=1 Tax=Bacillus sp. Marseille-P3661 TaxID=1936234 RepID=UPI000C828855|nr:formate dehydrogenase accessory protein FdhE [Bacillus sp. Marseille-P3661]
MSVVTTEYFKLQKEIIEKQDQWKHEIVNHINAVPNALKNDNQPLISQIQLNVDLEKYRQYIFELIDLLAVIKSEFKNELYMVKDIINPDILQQWVDEVLAYNDFYFNNFAEKNGLSQWLPYFLAEQAVRPYLRAISTVYQGELYETDPIETCPCCGEPIRLARLEGKVGKKVVHCPRCFANWSEKRSKCSHCGKDHSEALHYLHIEDNKKLQIHICEDCNGYVKVIDTRGTFKQENPAILDLNTIHLDILAQEKGYGVSKVKTTIN